MTKISSLSDIGTGIATNDTFVLVDASDPSTPNKKVQQQNLLAAGGLLPDGSAATPALRFTNDGNTGIYRAGTDTLAVATNGAGRLFVDGNGYIYGTASALSGDSLNTNGIGFFGGGVKQQSTVGFDFTQFYTSSGQAGPDASIFIPASNTFGVRTNGSERLRITSAGLVGIGTSSPVIPLDVNTGAAGSPVTGFGTSGADPFIHLERFTGASNYDAVRISAAFGGAQGGILTISNGTGASKGQQTFTERLRIDSSGRVGIGTTSPGYNFEVIGGASTFAKIGDNSNQNFLAGVESGVPVIYAATSAGAALPLAFKMGTTERARIDSSGRLLVGTSSASSTDNDANFPYLQLEGVIGDPSRAMLRCNGGTDQFGGPILYLSRSRGTSSGSKTSVANDDMLGEVLFLGADGADDRRAASIRAFVDGTPGTNDMPGRLIFSTTPDSSASPVERLRITNAGYVGINTTSPSVNLDVNGVINSSAGSAAAPSLTLGGDANSGLYSPGADQVAVATNGVEHLRIDSNGDLLSGTTGNLGYGGRNIILKSGQGYAGIASLTTESRFFNTWDSSAIPMTFYMGGNERLRITSAGLVGIGTSSPRTSLDLGTVNSVLTIAPADASQGLSLGLARRLNYGDGLIGKNLAGSPGSDAYITPGNGSGYSGVELRIGGDTVIYGSNAATTAGASVSPPTRLIVKGDTGNVGIGTTSPGARTEIRQDGSSAVELVRLVNNDVSGAGSTIKFRNFYDSAVIGSTSNPGFSLGGTLRLQTFNGSGVLNTGLVMDNQGRVGIGITSPAVSGLTIESASSTQGIELSTDTGFASGPTIRGYYRSGSSYRPLGITGSQVIFGIQDVEKARLDASGRLLVGTSTSAGNAKFEVTETRRLSATQNGSGWLELTDSAEVTSGVLTDIATVSMTARNTCYFRLEVDAGHTDNDGGYSGAVSIREGIIAQYGATPRVLNNAETRNLAGSVNAGVIATAVTTDVVTGTSGGTSTLVFRATVTMSGSNSGPTVPRVSYRLSLLSNVGNTVTVASNI